MKAKPTRKAISVKEQVIKEATKTNLDDLSTLTYQIPKATHQAFKAKSAANGETMKDVIISMINSYLDKH
jgi:hypothetical protein